MIVPRKSEWGTSILGSQKSYSAFLFFLALFFGGGYVSFFSLHLHFLYVLQECCKLTIDSGVSGVKMFCFSSGENLVLLAAECQILFRRLKRWGIWKFVCFGASSGRAGHKQCACCTSQIGACLPPLPTQHTPTCMNTKQTQGPNRAFFVEETSHWICPCLGWFHDFLFYKQEHTYYLLWFCYFLKSFQNLFPWFLFCILSGDASIRSNTLYHYPSLNTA